MQKTPIEIRPITELEGCLHFQAVQCRIWPGDAEGLVPTHVLVTQVKNGGLLLGAYAPDGPAESGGMVGMLLGWPGLVPDRTGGYTVKHCSHILGVLPEWRGQGIGRELKLAQRRVLLEQGITWATWTYDPLQRVNGVLNIHRLGATCVTYLENVYGEMNDPLNVGMPTDRFQVDWYLDSPRVVHALCAHREDLVWPPEKLEVLPTEAAGALRRPTDTVPRLDGRPLAVPLPDSVSALRGQSHELLIAWRLFVRRAVECAFAAGYVLVDCVTLSEAGWHYILIPRNGDLSGSSDWLTLPPG